MKPRVAPSLLPALAALAPARLVKKLDAAPGAAKLWGWDETGAVVRTDGGETVTLRPEDGVVSTIEQLSCSCLLSPRCYHLLAVVASLDVAEGSEAAAPSPPDAEAAHASHGPGPRGVAAPAPVEPAEGQRAVARLALRTAEELLHAGAEAAGAVLQGELLRVVHEARLEGAHRIAAASLRLVRGVRALRASEASFAATELVEDLADLLASAHRLAGADPVGPEVLGVARRGYHPHGNLRLTGLLCEPILARGGQAGVVSWLVDEHGNVFTIADVLPAGTSRARGAYDLSVALGDTSVTHRELCRSGLLVQDATASDDRRLGAGKAVRAVRLSTPTSWHDPAPRLLFAAPLPSQLERAFAALALPEPRRSRADTALFFGATVLGHDGTALLVDAAEAGVLRLVAPADHEELPYHENLRQLARAPGRRVEVVARVVFDARRTLAALALGAAPDVLPLGSAYQGHVNLGLDELRAADLGGGEPARLDASPDERAVDPLHVLRRRVERLALHGVRSLPPEARRGLDADRAALERRLLPTGSAVLAELHAAALASARGERRLVPAYLAAVTYERTATRALRRASFV